MSAHSGNNPHLMRMPASKRLKKSLAARRQNDFYEGEVKQDQSNEKKLIRL